MKGLEERSQGVEILSMIHSSLPSHVPLTHWVHNSYACLLSVAPDLLWYFSWLNFFNFSSSHTVKHRQLICTFLDNYSSIFSI